MRYENDMDARPLVVILDFGSQYTQLIARRIRELHVYCEIHPCTIAQTSADKLAAMHPQAIVLSGGPASVYAEGAPHIVPEVFELGAPILGICYGLQLLAHLLAGKVSRASEREYGPAVLDVQKNVGILGRFAPGDRTDVWMSHGDRIEQLPAGFEDLATSDNTPHCVVGNFEKKIFGVQFHPEVAHTPRGKDVLSAFLFDVAGLSPTWTPESFVASTVKAISEHVPSNAHAICGLSGGVDSSVAAVLCHRALGDRLTCVFVDNGLLRAGEYEYVQQTFREHFHIKLVAVDARREFLDALCGITDPEQKRKIIGRIFIDVFDREARKIAMEVGHVDYLVQGTLYPDVIESVSFKGPSAVIKSHHNVGGLPEKMNLKLIEPLRELFKDEVRLVGDSMGIPRVLTRRQPFPGPGLAIRCLGEVTDARLERLQKADLIVDEEIRAAGLYDSLWQSFCVLLPVRSVGVMGDERTYDEACAIRAVDSQDGMTADWSRLPYPVLAKISSRIINEVHGINRVVYDISSKPPATIEWE
jgi:GMP synthase (glutamine-hydrolysing)